MACNASSRRSPSAQPAKVPEHLADRYANRIGGQRSSLTMGQLASLVLVLVGGAAHGAIIGHGDVIGRAAEAPHQYLFSIKWENRAEKDRTA